MSLKFVIIPGNGAGDVEHSNWYAWVRDEVNKLDGATAILQNMPDSILAREKYWIPFMKEDLCCDENTVIIGHSSGAAAALRYAERNKVHGIILVSAYVSDLGDDTEKKSGYFNRPWKWDKIAENTKKVIQFGSTDDPFIPWEEMQEVADKVKSDLHKLDDKGHFMTCDFPELVDSVKEYIKDQS